MIVSIIRLLLYSYSSSCLALLGHFYQPFSLFILLLYPLPVLTFLVQVMDKLTSAFGEASCHVGAISLDFGRVFSVFFQSCVCHLGCVFVLQLLPTSAGVERVSS